MSKHVIFEKDQNWYFFCGHCPEVITGRKYTVLQSTAETHLIIKHFLVDARLPVR